MGFNGSEDAIAKSRILQFSENKPEAPNNITCHTHKIKAKRLTCPIMYHPTKIQLMNKT